MVDAAGAIYVIGGNGGGGISFQDVWASTDGGVRPDYVQGVVGEYRVGTRGWSVGYSRGSSTGVLGCACVRVRVRAMSVCICARAHLCVRVHLCACACACARVRACVRAFPSDCVCVRVCVASVCVCVCVCVCAPRRCARPAIAQRRLAVFMARPAPRVGGRARVVALGATGRARARRPQVSPGRAVPSRRNGLRELTIRP